MIEYQKHRHAGGALFSFKKLELKKFRFACEKSRECEICHHKLSSVLKYGRFCDDCRQTERYRYSEWLPEAGLIY